MSESKSKIISFRISAEWEALASAAASAAGDKNASAWCQRLAIEALSKMGKPSQSENVERLPESASVNDLFKALDNIRRLNLDCFKLFLKNKEQYKEFLNVIVASEEKWETINQSAGKSETEFSPAVNEPTAMAKDSAEFEIPGKENKTSEAKIAAEVNSNEYLLFAEEMKNEVTELITGERKFPGFHNGQTIECGESAIKNQMPVVSLILDATRQTDAGKSL